MEIKLVEWFNEHWYKIITETDDKPETIYIPSVTTKLGIIAKPFLAKWRGDVGNREADLRVFEAQQKGIRTHHGWYTLTTGGKVAYQPFQRPNYTEQEMAGMLEETAGNLAVVRYQDEMYDLWKLQRWLEIVKPEIVGSEIITYSLENKDAGTADNLMRLNAGKYSINGSKPLELPEGLYVVDLKTGASVDESAFMQTACYANNIKEMGLGECVGTLILHTGAKTRSAIEGLSTLYRSKEQMAEDYQTYRLASALWERKNADAKPDLFEFPALLSYEKEKIK